MASASSIRASPPPSFPRFLHTPRLTLELFSHSRPDHYDCILSAMNNPTAYAMMGDLGIHTPEQYAALCDATLLPSATTLRNSRHPIPAPRMHLCWVAHEGDEAGPLVGGFSLAQRGAKVPPDMGWCVAEGSMGKGYASEAGKEVLRFCTEELGVKQIIAWLKLSNIASVRVAEKIGFVEGMTREVGNDPGATGKPVVRAIYVLPGMTVDDNMNITFWPE